MSCDITSEFRKQQEKGGWREGGKGDALMLFFSFSGEGPCNRHVDSFVFVSAHTPPLPIHPLSIEKREAEKGGKRQFVQLH